MSDRAWTAVFAAFDDEALVALGNPGLLRRARKDVDGGRVAWAEGSDAMVVLREDGTVAATVRADARGPAAASCDCVAAGVCQHVLAVALWLRSVSADAPAARALEEVLGADPATYARAAGAAAVRRARQLPVEATLVDEGDRLVVTMGDGRVVRIAAGVGFRGIVSDTPEADRATTHLLAIRAVFLLAGRSWTWPDDGSAPAAGLTAAQRDAIAAVRSAISGALRTGLAHLPEEAVDRLDAEVVRSSAAGLHELARLVRGSVGLLDHLVERRDDVSERDAALALSTTWAHTVALDTARPDAVDGLRGVARRSFIERSDLRLVPLGARWFATPAGARGITVTLWDEEAGEVVEATSARPAGVDAAFRRSRHAALAWGVPLAHITDGPFTLRTPRVAGDGTLSTGTASVVERAGDYDGTVLAHVAVDRWADLARAHDEARRDRGPTPLLLAPTATADLRIDEVGQALVWPLADATGEVVETRLPVSREVADRVDALTALVASRAEVAFVLVAVTVRGGRRVLEPTSVFVRRPAGLALIVLDFVERDTAKDKRLAALRARFAALVQRSSLRSALDAPLVRPSIVEALALPVLDLLDELVATGRPGLGERHRQVLATAERRARDLALETVARSIAAVRSDPGPAAVLRCYAVLARALDTALDETRARV